MTRYLDEFPDFDRSPDAESLLAAGWSDSSWHNNSCPSFLRGDFEVCLNHADPALREVNFGDTLVFQLDATGAPLDDEGATFPSLAAALAHVSTLAGEG